MYAWRGGPKAPANPWGAKSIEWLVSSPPPKFNFPTIPRVVGGPYKFGVKGARHAVFDPVGEPLKAPDQVAAAPGR